jgi:hypothetical protein
MDRCVSTGEGMESDRESEKKLNKDRLTAYYNLYNPGLLNSVDKVLKTFEGRNEVLNENLKRKVRDIFTVLLCSSSSQRHSHAFI